MTFEEWWGALKLPYVSFITDKQMAKEAWEAGIQEGINRMYLLYDMCPECKETLGRHKMDCGRL